MTTKTTFYEKNVGEITQVKCKIGLWFLSFALSLINIYVCPKFNFNPFCTFQDMARTGINYEKNGYGEITLSIYKIELSFWCTTLSLTAIYL